MRTAADEAGKALVALLCPHAVKLVLPQLFEGMEPKRLWQTKVGSLQLLGALTKTAPAQIAKCLPEIVPNVSHAFSDAKPQVKVSWCFVPRQRYGLSCRQVVHSSTAHWMLLQWRTSFASCCGTVR